jgi:hypothetical protein
LLFFEVSAESVGVKVFFNSTSILAREVSSRIGNSTTSSASKLSCRNMNKP